MNDRLSTGNRELDEILDGGIPLHSINLIVGLPGTGKSIMAESIAFDAVRHGHRALYLTSLSEPLDKVLRYLQAFDFFDPLVVQETVIFGDLSQTLRDEGIVGAVEKIRSLLRAHQVDVLVIDSFRAFHAFVGSEEEFRRGLYELAFLLSSLAVTSFWVGEYSSAEVGLLPEFAIADGIIETVLRQVGVRDARYLRVHKLRGSHYRGGEHSFRIGPGGLMIFPRLAMPAQHMDYELARQRIKTGVALLDEMIADGFWKGSSTVTFGPPGSGKTLLGLHFVFRGIEVGERSLFLTLQENPTQLSRVTSAFGWDLQEAQDSGMLELLYMSPVDVYIDEVVVRALRLIKERKIERVVIDSLNDLEVAAPDAIRFREYLYALLQSLAGQGVTVLMTHEVTDLFATSYLSQFGVSHMSDNLILLHYLRERSEVVRAIAVLKTRGSAHEPNIRQFRISSDGLEIGEPFSADTRFPL